MYFLPPFGIPSFPNPQNADKRGLVAVGGKLTPDWLISAYSIGLFPWFEEGEDILWWSPDPRAVLIPSQVKVHKSMVSVFNQKKFELKIDTSFSDVIKNCAIIKRKKQKGTWINSLMIENYIKLHKLGYAHSFEAWKNNKLVGGLYGISIGKIFFGESMFSIESNASKFAFISLCRFLEKNNFDLIDCQQDTAHLRTLGSKMISRMEFLNILKNNQNIEFYISSWKNMF